MSRKNDVLNRFANESYVLMCPADAAKHGFRDGECVRLTNERGSLTTTLRIGTEVADGELFMPWHFAESRVNNLTRAEMDPDSKISPFKLSACAVEKT